MTSPELEALEMEFVEVGDMVEEEVAYSEFPLDLNIGMEVEIDGDDAQVGDNPLVVSEEVLLNNGQDQEEDGRSDEGDSEMLEDEEESPNPSPPPQKHLKMSPKAPLQRNHGHHEYKTEGTIHVHEGYLDDYDEEEDLFGVEEYREDSDSEEDFLPPPRLCRFDEVDKEPEFKAMHQNGRHNLQKPEVDSNPTGKRRPGRPRKIRQISEDSNLSNPAPATPKSIQNNSIEPEILERSGRVRVKPAKYRSPSPKNKMEGSEAPQTPQGGLTVNGQASTTSAPPKIIIKTQKYTPNSIISTPSNGNMAPKIAWSGNKVPNTAPSGTALVKRRPGRPRVKPIVIQAPPAQIQPKLIQEISQGSSKCFQNVPIPELSPQTPCKLEINQEICTPFTLKANASQFQSPSAQSSTGGSIRSKPERIRVKPKKFRSPSPEKRVKERRKSLQMTSGSSKTPTGSLQTFPITSTPILKTLQIKLERIDSPSSPINWISRVNKPGNSSGRAKPERIRIKPKKYRSPSPPRLEHGPPQLLPEQLSISPGSSPLKCIIKREKSPENISKKSFRRPGKLHPYTCDKCPRVFPTSERCEAHKKCHNRGRPRKIPTLTRQDIGEFHNNSEMGKLGPGEVKMDEGELEEFEEDEIKAEDGLKNRRGSFESNISASSKGNFECKICGKVLLRKENFINHHKQVHSGELPYQCKFCPRKFAVKKVLARHILCIHQRESREIRCEVCSKTFPYRYQLVQHLKHHSEVLKFNCSLCRMRFSSKVNLEAHFESQHPSVEVPAQVEKPIDSPNIRSKMYRCSKCSKSFSYCANLTRHKCKLPSIKRPKLQNQLNQVKLTKIHVPRARAASPLEKIDKNRGKVDSGRPLSRDLINKALERVKGKMNFNREPSRINYKAMASGKGPLRGSFDGNRSLTQRQMNIQVKKDKENEEFEDEDDLEDEEDVEEEEDYEETDYEDYEEEDEENDDLENYSIIEEDQFGYYSQILDKASLPLLLFTPSPNRRKVIPFEMY